MRLAASRGASRHAVTYKLRLTRAASSSPANLVPVPDRYLSSPRSTPNPDAKNIAVLGGGITGLTTAYHLAQTIPHAKISVFERDRFGGWVDSELVNVGSDETVLFEWGPRSLRPDLAGPGRATLRLIADLSLAFDAVFTYKSKLAAQNRFIYYPDRLNLMPTPYGNPFAVIFGAAKSLLLDPTFKGVLSSLLAEPTVSQRSDQLADESVGDFLRRRFGIAAADNLASAVFHGIYAGDIYQLSARTCLPRLWYLEGRDPDGSGVILEQIDLLFKGNTPISFLDHRFNQFTPDNEDSVLREQHFPWRHLLYHGGQSAMYTLAGGLKTVITKLFEALYQRENVDLYLYADIQSLSMSDDRRRPRPVVRFDGPDSDSAPTSFDYVVSTLRPGTMAKIMQNQEYPQKKQFQVPESVFKSVDKAVSVMVVNLYYDSPSLLPEHYDGFGYLIPRSVALDQNPERALGVIFGSMSSGHRGPGTHQSTRPLSQEEIDERRKDIQGLVDEFPKQMNAYRAQAKAEGRDGHYKKVMEDVYSEEHKRWQRIWKADFEKLAKYPMPPHGKYGEVKFAENPMGQDTAPGTKLTVMLGGHWWNGWKDSDIPDEEEAIKMAKNVLKRHLDVDDEPVVAKARLQRDCIPQYPVGYRDYMAKIHKEVLVDQFKGRVKVAGPWWQGAVGVNDCIRRAREVAYSIEHKWDDKTGLEDFVGKEKWLLIDKRTGLASIDPMCDGWE